MTQISEAPVLDELVARIPPIVDLDAHVVEPADLWTSRLPAKYRDVGPHIVLAPAPGSIELDGALYKEAPGEPGSGPDVAWWFYEDHRYSIKRPIAASGFPPEEVTMRGVTYDEMRPGCYKVADRLADMDINGVEAQLCYPNYPRFAGQIFAWGQDKELSKLCVEAYNDWMVEEWAGESGGRLIPLCMVPLWDVELAAAEVRRNAARGVRAVAFSEIPPTSATRACTRGYWDPFFRACDETGTVVCMHIGSGTKTPQSSPDAPELVSSVVIFGNSAVSLTDFLFSGVLARFPNLKLHVRRVPDRLDPLRASSAATTPGRPTCGPARRPCSTSCRASTTRQIYSCFFKDPVGRRADRAGRHRQRHLRDRLPPPGLHLAELPPGRRQPVRSPRPGRHQQDRPQQRHPAPGPRPPARADTVTRGATGDPAEGEPMTDYESVPGLLVSHDDQVLRLTLDLAERRNALNDEVVAAMIDAIDAAGRDEDVRAIVLAGAATTSARASTSWPATPAGGPRPRVGSIQRRLPSQAHRLIPLVLRVQVPVVCVGAGLGGRHRAPPGARRRLHRGRRRRPLLGAVRGRGFTPDSGATWLLPRRVGVVRARDLLLLGRVVSGAEAADWGMIHRGRRPATSSTPPPTSWSATLAGSAHRGARA